MSHVDGNLSAFCHRDDATVKEMARASEERWQRGEARGPLDGVPVSIKDVLRVAGWPTRLGSKAVDAKGPWSVDSPAVARMREAGAVFLGMTTTPELGWKGVTDSPLHGTTRNPWNLRMTPGGSSGGGAAAVAAGLGPLSLGTDGAGSVRGPASCSGLVGLKPTLGVVPADTSRDAFGNNVYAGPLSRTIADAAVMHDAIRGPSAKDPWTFGGAQQHPLSPNLMGEDLSGVRIG
jgi:aspartyl-tRNA(Asn)/glutamyl-tRNA(Gln) amidotransferase subunit A